MDPWRKLDGLRKEHKPSRISDHPAVQAFGRGIPGPRVRAILGVARYEARVRGRQGMVQLCYAHAIRGRDLAENNPAEPEPRWICRAAARAGAGPIRTGYLSAERDCLCTETVGE